MRAKNPRISAKQHQYYTTHKHQPKLNQVVMEKFLIANKMRDFYNKKDPTMSLYIIGMAEKKLSIKCLSHPNFLLSVVLI